MQTVIITSSIKLIVHNNFTSECVFNLNFILRIIKKILKLVLKEYT
jgi:hypothetical protein